MDDYQLALQLEEDQLHSLHNGVIVDITNDIVDRKFGDKTKLPLSLVDPQWEIIDPIPDLRSLFIEFNIKYFWGKLDGIEVKWSPRMKL